MHAINKIPPRPVAAPASCPTPSYDFDVGCSVCGDSIRFSLADLAAKRDIRCPRGHSAASCSGLDEAIAFVEALLRAGDRLANYLSAS